MDITNEKIAIASDHAGFALKQYLQNQLGVGRFRDFGAFSEESMDYPDTIAPACAAVGNGELARGIVICGTGIGASIVANKTRGVRAALCHNPFTAEMSRRHNNANVLVLGARVIAQEQALELVRLWLATPFDGGRHQARLDKVGLLER